MKHLFLISCIIIGIYCSAQSHRDIKATDIEDDKFEYIYPDFIEDEISYRIINDSSVAVCPRLITNHEEPYYTHYENPIFGKVVIPPYVRGYKVCAIDHAAFTNHPTVMAGGEYFLMSIIVILRQSIYPPQLRLLLMMLFGDPMV